MVSLFSRRSILVLTVGLILGFVVGLGYWTISPVLIQTKWPPVQRVNPPPALYESYVTLGISSSDESDTSTKALNAKVQRYIIKLNSFPFLEFLRNESSNPTPMYPRTIEELDEMISISSGYQAGERPKVEVKVTSEDPDEAFYLTSSILPVLQDYLSKEQALALQEKYTESLTEIATVKADLLEARKELGDIAPQIDAYDLNLNPVYIAAKAKLVTLDSELSVATSTLALLTGEDNTSGEEYTRTAAAINSLSVALAEVRSQVASMEAQAEADTFELNLNYTILSNKVQALDARLGELTKIMALSSGEYSSDLEAVGIVLIGGPTIPLDPQNPPTKPKLKPSGRMTVMQGAGLGLVIAWLVLNRKWVLKRLGSSSPADPGEEEEDEEE